MMIMKTFKIVFLLLAVVCLTLSGSSNDNYLEINEDQIENKDNVRLLSHEKTQIKLPGQA